MGLLNKAEGQGKELKPSLVSNMDDLKSHGSFLRTASRLHDTNIIESPGLYGIGLFFDLIKTGISKAVLLLKISRSSDVLYPLFLKGFDNTSSNRLRLDADSAIIKKTKKGYKVNKKDLSFFSNALSTREFDMLENIIFFPVIFNNIFFGVLGIFEYDSTFSISSFESKYLKVLEQGAGNKLFYRYDVLPERNYFVKKHENYRDEYQSRAEYSDKHKSGFQLLNLSFKKYFDFLVKKYKHVSRNFIRYDIINVLSSLFSNNGSVYSSSTDNIVIIFQNNSIQNADIIIHQIKIALTRIFPFFNKEYLESKSCIYPEDSEEIRNLII